MNLKFKTPRQAQKDQHMLKEKQKKKEYKKKKYKLQKEGKLKKKNMEKVVANKVFYPRPHMFSCIRLGKRQQCCKPKIGGETQVTNKLSPESSKDQIQYMTICERSIM